MGTFLFKWPHPEAKEVYVTGTFDDWGKTEKLNQVGDTWEKDVELSSADHKILYKFVVDGEWITDHTAPQEDDGHHNINNVLLPEDIKRKEGSGPGAAVISSAAAGSTTAALAGAVGLESSKEASAPKDATISSAAPGSTSAGLAGQVPLESSKDATKEIPGGFPDTPANESESFGVNPIAGSSGISNPVQLAPGEQVPASSKAIDSNVTTSKEDYEKAGSSAAEPETVKAEPIPASSGIGNPVQLQPGEKVPDHEQVTGNKVDSNVTTSKEDYEKGGSGVLPVLGGALAAAGASAAAAVGLSKKEDDKKNLIPESSLPMGEGSNELADAGPTLQSAGPGSTTAGLAGAVPMEQKRQAMVIDPADAPKADDVDKAVPETVKESLQESNQSPEAASSPVAVKEKSAMEKELLGKVPTSEAHGETESAAAAQTSYYGLATEVPRTVEQSMSEAQVPPEAAASSSVVAEKSDFERELLQKVKPDESAGQPAPTLAAATSATAPAATTTDTAAETSKTPGISSGAAAAVADGAGEEGAVSAPKTTAPTEKTEADATEYAPPHTGGTAPGVAPGAAAAVSDGAEDPTLAEEPAVKMMNQNEASETAKTSEPAVTAATATTPASTAKDTSKDTPAATGTTKSATTTPSKPIASTQKSATSTPSKPTTQSAASTPASTDTKDKKKKHRISSFFKKIFD